MGGFTYLLAWRCNTGWLGEATEKIPNGGGTQKGDEVLQAERKPTRRTDGCLLLFFNPFTLITMFVGRTTSGFLFSFGFLCELSVVMQTRRETHVFFLPVRGPQKRKWDMADGNTLTQHPELLSLVSVNDGSTYILFPGGSA